MSGASFTSHRLVKNVEQRPSHAALCQDVSGTPAPNVRSRSGHLDAIVVPASRPASFLKPVIRLSALLGVQLVVLCSKKTRGEQVAERVSTCPGARALIVDFPKDWSHPEVPTRTSNRAFKRANANRNSDLSAKRNVGLLLARLHGWNKIVFVDDDVTLTRTDNVARLAGQLDHYQVAGMILSEFPDNSVVCHARRAAGLSQDVFLTGAVLGVHCNNLPLAFFPDIYNEDWFFFAREAASRELPRVGRAIQAEYDPYASTDRARREEFGDLLAEGLFALLGQADPSVLFRDQVRAANAAYWSRFIDARHEVIAETAALLRVALDRIGDNGRGSAALTSLAASQDQLDHMITADDCVNFVDAWQSDLDDWQRFSSRINNVGSSRGAMHFLQLDTWTHAEFGDPAVESENELGRLRTLMPLDFSSQSALELPDGC
jgi:glycosyltransferase involved in cell wall biosynthesis